MSRNVSAETLLTEAKARPATSASFNPCEICGTNTSRIEKRCFFHTYSEPKNVRAV